MTLPLLSSTIARSTDSNPGSTDLVAAATSYQNGGTLENSASIDPSLFAKAVEQAQAKGASTSISATDESKNSGKVTDVKAVHSDNSTNPHRKLVFKQTKEGCCCVIL